jgi:hypothetical protein
MTRNKLIAAGGVALFLLVGVLTLWLNRDRGYDAAFDTAVAEPAYAEGGPLVVFDEGHNNAHAIDGAYHPFAQLLRHDGYQVRASEDEITAETLAPAQVLVIVGARGSNDANDAAAFTAAEASAISEWVLRGGSLLLVTDHWPFGAAMAELGDRFGVEMSRGLAADAAHADPALGESHIVFSRENGLLLDHPITNGRNERERVERVLTFTGQAVRGPADATPFMRLAQTATNAPPSEPRIERRGEDVRVSMTYGEPVAVAGWAQGAAVRFGRGRVVVLGEMGMLRAAKERDGATIGMNHPGYDNRQLALNIMHWLSRLT